VAGRLDEPAAEELRVDVAQENLCADTVGPNRDADDTMEWTASDTERKRAVYTLLTAGTASESSFFIRNCF
jgi:hypothetical protein